MTAIQPSTEWLAEAGEAGIREPKAMTLATAAATGVPSPRIVLLRGHDEDAFTGYTSRLRDRIADVRVESGWRIEHLAP